ncbi:HAMP domain-containing sensor histidine kinase [Clostridium oceanicum]|uniref:histidine kinase n=1 Tax=Clostridium oceanicum TaxID=1543 RepID=A0ABP3V4J7_9CLOT
MRNKTTLKLSSYFAISLFIFAVIIGGTFSYLFRKQTIETHKTQLSNRAKSISTTVSDYMGNINIKSKMGGGMGSGFGAYMRSLSSIAGADAWVIDKDKNLITAGSGKGFKNGIHDVSYANLPEDADKIISEVFLDKTVFSEDFSGLLEEPTLTVGVPIKDRGNQIMGVVLLHSPVVGTNEAVKSGIGILFLSILLGIIVSFLLSLWLSKKFTSPILQKEAEDAIRLDKIRRDFVANISHELKTPVTVMRGSLEALTDKVVTEPKMVESYHKQMLKESIYLQRLIGDLLDLSKLQNADFEMEKSNVSIFELLHETIRSAKHIGKSKNIKIEFEKDKDFIIEGDYGRLRQMLMIILDNAIKFSPKDGVVKVLLRNRELTIKDYGIGISKDELPFIFERFYKSRTEENKSGTGLGLAIAKQIAHRHNINLWAKSIEGTETEFKFKF